MNLHERLTAVIALLLAAASSALAGENTRTSVCHSVPYPSFILADKFVKVDVSAAQIRESPAWDAESGREPPLSVGAALRLASAEFARTVPDPQSWRLFRIVVEGLCDKRAVYMTWWSKQVSNGNQLVVPVLMSGVAVSTSSAVAAAKASETPAETSAPSSRAASDASDFQKACGNLTYKSYFSIGSLHVEVEIPLDRLASSPPWNAGADEEPPLPPGEAVRLSKSELRRVVQEEDDWYFVNLSLTRTCGSRAYYEVEWQREANGRSFHLTIPVLMSGEAVPTGRAIKEARARASDGTGLR